MLFLLDVFDTRSRQNDPGGFEKKVTILAFKAHRKDRKGATETAQGSWADDGQTLAVSVWPTVEMYLLARLVHVAT